LLLPVPIGLHLVDKDGSVLTAMAGEVALAVTVDIEPPNLAAALHWFLPHARKHFLALPRNIARKTDIHG